jgi:methylenetetrahydrofolate dehydrogenase (NADP+)/methenyltetrahydrofolate cyclohydrolase
MRAIQLYSKTLANTIRKNLQNTIYQNSQKGLRPPGLTILLIGDDLASLVYVRNKQRACEAIGMKSCLMHYPPALSEAELLALIHQLNQDATVDGILIQLPLPKMIRVDRVLDAIDPMKDVDGFHPTNMGLLAQGRPYFRACTPYGIMQLLESLSQPLKGMHAVVVGASNIVGKPMALELLHAGCTVTICHSATRALSEHIKQADILISAIGKQHIIQSQWIKPGAIVIDAGINRNTEGHLTGDIEYTTAAERAYAITPVPGGVGPMTVSMLLENTYKAYQYHLTLNHS